jgi:hypothetical protein
MRPNFVLLDASLPDVARLVTAMVRARDAVESRSWSHPQEPATEEWWADVLADPRARTRKQRSVEVAISARCTASPTSHERRSLLPAANATGRQPTSVPN